MIFTFETNQHAKYLGQRSLTSNVTVRKYIGAHTHTRLTDYSTWTTKLAITNMWQTKSTNTDEGTSQLPTSSC